MNFWIVVIACPGTLVQSQVSVSEGDAGIMRSTGALQDR
jgi:hypothetical protein